MFFSVLISQAATTSAQQSYSNTTIYPFPYTGRFRCRITGYQIKTGPGSTASTTTVAVVSRRMTNPLSPYIFQVIVPGINSTVQATQIDFSGFSRTGWWECDLSNGIDFALVSPEGLPTVSAIQLLLHFELERVVEGSLLMKSS